MKIELSELPKNHTLNRAMRRVARNWSVVYAKLLCLEWEWTDDSGMSSIGPVAYGATNGINLILNPAGVEALAAESMESHGDAVGYVAFLLVHEGVHAILNHGCRLSKFTDRKAANVAADYKVDEMIDARNKELYSKQFPIPPWAYLDPALSAPLSTEQLYQHIKKNEQLPPPEPTQPEPQQADGSVPPVPQDSDPNKGEDANGSEGDPAPSDNGDPSGAGDEGMPTPGAGDPSDLAPSSPAPGGGDGQPSPVPGDPGPASSTAAPGEGPSSDGTGIPAPGAGEDTRPGAGSIDTAQPAVSGKTDDEVNADLEEQNERIMMQSAIVSAQCGKEDVSARRLAEERAQAEAQDWAHYAEQFVETRCKTGWRAPYNHGVYITTGMVAPDREGKKVGDIVMVVDSSGSITSAAWKRFLELGQYILDDIKPERLFLISCSSEVKDYVVLEAGDTVPSELMGGGGTSFREAFDWIEMDPANVAIDPLLLIYFTDGICDDHKDMEEPIYPVLWLSYNKPKEHFPWGEFASITVS